MAREMEGERGTMSDLILALDCSLRWTNVAVLMDGDVLVSECLDIGRRQAAELPLVVERLLTAARHGFKDIDLLAVTNGPGYFTGIRIGVSYAAALAYALGKRIVPVSTLQMLAYGSILESRPVLAAVYAGKERLYAASFGCVSGLSAGEYRHEELEQWLRAAPPELVIMSDDPEKATETANLSCPVLQALPDASIVARIAYREHNTAVSPMDLRIAYHRAPQIG